MKALRYILYSLVILGAAGLLAYQYFVEHNLESGNVIKCGLIIAGAIIGMIKAPRRRISNKKALYQKSYGEFIQNAFSDDKTLEKQLYNAIHDYNMNKPAAAVNKLNKLRKECQRTADLYAVTVFLGLCYDDMRLYTDAIKEYEAALKIRATSTVYSNLGLCYYRTGNTEDAQESYENAIRIDPHNAFAYNNLSALFFRETDYYDALEYAEMDLAEDPNMVQALSTAAICCALIGETEDYERYYRQAVTKGYDGKKIKATIQALDTSI